MSTVCQYLESKLKVIKYKKIIIDIILKETFGDKIKFNSHFERANVLPNTSNISLTGSELYRGIIIAYNMYSTQY